MSCGIATEQAVINFIWHKYHFRLRKIYKSHLRCIKCFKNEKISHFYSYHFVCYSIKRTFSSFKLRKFAKGSTFVFANFQQMMNSQKREKCFDYYLKRNEKIRRSRLYSRDCELNKIYTGNILASFIPYSFCTSYQFLHEWYFTKLLVVISVSRFAQIKYKHIQPL
jgi:hypothetical protein